MSGRSISVASVFDWTDALPRNNVNSLPGRFMYRNGRSMTKGELEILTGIYNNRIEKKPKSPQTLKSSASVQEKSSKNKEKIITDSIDKNTVKIGDEAKTIINIRLPRTYSPPAAPCCSPEMTRQSSCEEFSSGVQENRS